MTDAPFVLERVENPHPRMLTRALQLRRTARAASRVPGIGRLLGLFWLGYRECMIDATGETAEAVEAYLDRHDIDPASIATRDHPVPVNLGARRPRL